MKNLDESFESINSLKEAISKKVNGAEACAKKIVNEALDTSISKGDILFNRLMNCNSVSDIYDEFRRKNYNERYFANALLKAYKTKKLDYILDTSQYLDFYTNLESRNIAFHQYNEEYVLEDKGKLFPLFILYAIVCRKVSQINIWIDPILNVTWSDNRGKVELYGYGIDRGVTHESSILPIVEDGRFRYLEFDRKHAIEGCVTGMIDKIKLNIIQESDEVNESKSVNECFELDLDTDLTACNQELEEAMDLHDKITEVVDYLMSLKVDDILRGGSFGKDFNNSGTYFFCRENDDDSKTFGVATLGADGKVIAEQTLKDSGVASRNESRFIDKIASVQDKVVEYIENTSSMNESVLMETTKSPIDTFNNLNESIIEDTIKQIREILYTYKERVPIYDYFGNRKGNKTLPIIYVNRGVKITSIKACYPERYFLKREVAEIFTSLQSKFNSIEMEMIEDVFIPGVHDNGHEIIIKLNNNMISISDQSGNKIVNSELTDEQLTESVLMETTEAITEKAKNTSKEHNNVLRIINDLLHAYSSDTHYGKSVSYNKLLKDKYDAKSDSGEFLVNMSFRPNPKVSINYKEGEAEKILFDSVNLFKDALEGELEELGFTNYIIETLQNTLHVTKNNGNNPVVAKFKGSVLSANIHVRILVDYFKDLEEHAAIDTYDQLNKDEIDPVVEVKPVNESIFENKYEFLIWLGDLASENGPDVIERIIYAEDSDAAYEKLTRMYAKKRGYEKEDLQEFSENNAWEDLWLDSDPSGGDPGVIGAMENGHIIEDVIEADALSGDRISKKLVKKWFSPNDRDVLLDESINPVNEAIEERKSAKKFEVGSEKTFTEDSEEYAQLQKAADKLTDLSVKNYKYFVGNTYLDFGSGWQWTTILAKKPNEVEFQVLSPLSWRNILNAQSEEELDAAIDQLRSDEYFHDKIETPNASSSERDIFNYLDSIED